MDKIFKALADKHRRMILTILKDQELGVGEMVGKLPIGQATVSSHLAILRKANLVEVRILGKQRFYKINDKIFCSFVEVLNRFCEKTELNPINEIIVRR